MNKYKIIYVIFSLHSFYFQLFFSLTMSLNWVMLTQDGTAPVPLPQEKIFFTQSHVKMVLDCSET